MKQNKPEPDYQPEKWQLLRVSRICDGSGPSDYFHAPECKGVIWSGSWALIGKLPPKNEIETHHCELCGAAYFPRFGAPPREKEERRAKRNVPAAR